MASTSTPIADAENPDFESYMMIAAGLKLVTSLDDIIWLSPFLALCGKIYSAHYSDHTLNVFLGGKGSAPQKAGYAGIYACICVYVALASLLISNVAEIGLHIPEGTNSTGRYWTLPRFISLAAGVALGANAAREFSLWYSESAANRAAVAKARARWLQKFTCGYLDPLMAESSVEGSESAMEALVGLLEDGACSEPEPDFDPNVQVYGDGLTREKRVVAVQAAAGTSIPVKGSVDGRGQPSAPSTCPATEPRPSPVDGVDLAMVDAAPANAAPANTVPVDAAPSRAGSIVAALRGGAGSAGFSSKASSPLDVWTSLVRDAAWLAGAKRLVLVAMCGTVDGLCLLTAFLVGSDIGAPSLVVGSLTAAAGIVLASWQLARFKPFADFVQSVPPWVLLASVSAYVLLGGLLRPS
jgi:hypothetical protein